jgi:hypothetical protein
MKTTDNQHFVLSIADAKLHRASLDRFKREQVCGRATGNYHLTTSAGFRLAVASFKADVVRDYLLNEMGMGPTVEDTPEGLTITFHRFDIYSPATVMRDLQGSFRLLFLMHEDGRQVLKIIGLKQPVIS